MAKHETDFEMTNRIYSSLYNGSMVGAGAMVFAVWTYAIANQENTRDANHPFQVTINNEVLATILGESDEDVGKAIEFLCAPDERSRSTKQGGRRLIELEKFRYWVVNGDKYDKAEKIDRRRSQLRTAQSKWRAKK